jgi:lysophospholipase L1-like esterase
VSPQLLDIENQLAPNFSELLQIPNEKSSGFLDLTSKNSLFSYTDGVHLSGKSSKLVSEEIALWIKDRERDEDLNHPKK